MKLDMGAGTNPYLPDNPEWLHHDCRCLPHIEYVFNILTRMPFNDNTIDELRAYSILEHVQYAKVDKVLADWYRILKPGCMITVLVPYIDGVLRGRTLDLTDDKDFMGYLGGGQDYPENYHISHFDKRLLEKRLRCTGFKKLQWLHSHNEEPLGVLGLEMRVRAWK